MWLFLLISCGDTPNDASSKTDTAVQTVWNTNGCRVDGTPLMTHPNPDRLQLARQLQFETEVPAEAELWIDGVWKGSWSERTSHQIPILELLPERTHEVTLELTCSGGTERLGPFTISTPPLDIPWPDVTRLVHEPERMSPGLTLLDLGSPGTENYIAVLNDRAEPVWVWRGDEKIVDARLMPDGTIWAMELIEIIVLDRLGNQLARYGHDPVDPTAVVLDTNELHHEVFPTEDGQLFTLGRGAQVIDDYPTTYDPDGPTATRTVEDPLVLQIEPTTGEILREWSMLSLLEPTRLGHLSLSMNPHGLDWGHMNAVTYYPQDERFMVSLRHQDAVVQFAADGSIDWILGHHDGWLEGHQPFLLEPKGAPFDWNIHQHAPTKHPNDPNRVLMFDNGNNRRVTPYDTGPGAESSYSRFVEYTIDPEAMTVEQRWEYKETATGRLFSQAFGDADYLENGNVLGVFGFLFAEEGRRNDAQGLGLKSTRLVEVNPETDEVAWDIRFNDDADDAPNGWQAHRAQRIRTLYVAEQTTPPPHTP